MKKVRFIHTKNIRKIAFVVMGGVLLCGIVVCIWLLTHPSKRTAAPNPSADTLTAQATQRLDKELAKNISADDRVTLLQAKISNYESVGKYDDAILTARTLAKEFPQVAAYQAEIARLYGLKGDSIKQRQAYNDAIRIIDTQPVTDQVKVEREYYIKQMQSIGGQS